VNSNESPTSLLLPPKKRAGNLSEMKSKISATALTVLLANLDVQGGQLGIKRASINPVSRKVSGGGTYAMVATVQPISVSTGGPFSMTSVVTADPATVREKPHQTALLRADGSLVIRWETPTLFQFQIPQEADSVDAQSWFPRRFEMTPYGGIMTAPYKSDASFRFFRLTNPKSSNNP